MTLVLFLSFLAPVLGNKLLFYFYLFFYKKSWVWYLHDRLQTVDHSRGAAQKGCSPFMKQYYYEMTQYWK